MLKAFNAFQIVCLFAAFPFLIGWLWSGPFPYSTAAFWVALVSYLVLFGVMTEITYDKIDKE